ncbi:MAG: aryl-sulfate sulfotransferase [Candidatus Marinimicrobia bacterium]|jgi:hypothetical protein|nr:aryl-sulfate sulfotransferase [Candidatus Neomarinimicrobiota bacterium]|tara:strand:- start:62 stop:2119 length:2058 start_codon:yes stop_codon:yes gene_type:complete
MRFIFILLFNFLFANLIKPLNSSSLNYIHVLFEWEQEPDALGYNFQLFDYNTNQTILDTNISDIIYIDKENIAWATSYYWRVRPILFDSSYAKWINTHTFTINEPKFGNKISSYIDSLNYNLFNEGYTIAGISNWLGGAEQFNGTCLIDQSGNEIWNDGHLNVMLNHINKNGQMFGGQDVSWAFTSGIEFNYDLDIIWREAEDYSLDQHELQQLPNGNYMGLVPIREQGPIPVGDWTTLFQNIGYQADGITYEFDWVGQKLVEFDNITGEEVWSWNPFEYFSMDDYDSIGGTWIRTAVLGRNFYDWLHTNSFYFDDKNNEIYISHKHLSRITKINYPAGDVLWMMGPPGEFIASGDSSHICTSLGFSWQHHVQLLDNGNILFFDNGNLSSYFLGTKGAVSRALKINVNQNNECELIWEYILPPDLVTYGRGSVQLLNNGNYLITAGTDMALEITPNNELVWSADFNIIALYRTYRIPSLFPDAFSVTFPGLSSDGSNEKFILSDSDENLHIIVHNVSGYENKYFYSISDNKHQFDNQNGLITIAPYEFKSIGINANSNDRSFLTHFEFEIYPVHFPNTKKNYAHAFTNSIDNIYPRFELLYNYPNPFNLTTTIRFNYFSEETLPERYLRIYNITGRLVKSLVDNETLTPGVNEINWRADNLSSGVYFVQLQIGSFVQTRKLVLLK